MVQAPFLEGLVDAQRIPDGPAFMEGACTSIKRVEQTLKPALLTLEPILKDYWTLDEHVFY
jgi:hypothetical protein